MIARSSPKGRKRDGCTLDFVLIQTTGRCAAIAQDSVTLSIGERLAADLVLVGIGVRPAVALQRRPDLRDREVVVDEFLQTSMADIYAAADIARWPDKRREEHIRVEHWVVAQRQGQAAARNRLGLRQRFDAVPFF